MIVPADPAGGQALTGAANWLQDAVSGPLAPTLAVIAVANVGFLMLAGRIDIRRGAQVVIGCFMVFGASAMAQGMMDALAVEPAPVSAETQLPDFVEPSTVRATGTSPFDPYAGAAVPQ